jgi:hypothetical protein
LLLDDAHAGEQFVAQAWSVNISRYSEPELYQRLLGAISSELSGIYLQRLQTNDPDPLTRDDVRLFPIGAMRRKAVQLDLVLGSVEGDLRFRYTMIRPALERCLLYISWEGFLLRPYIPPTAQHSHFIDASQRLYISATLGDGGELERAFGRAPIERLPVPVGWDQRSSGRRFFLFPELIREVDARSLTRTIIGEIGKALVIAPSDRRLEESKSSLVPPGINVFASGDIETTLEGFRRATKGVLALANRYDGIDLADESCRLTVLDGMPSGQHLQERFLVRSLRAGRVLEERLRTRVIQGAGRCTRGLRDHSAVIILGDGLTRFLQRIEVRSALRPEIQAEIEFGVTNSEVEEDALRMAVRSFMDQDDGWQNEAEPYLAELRRDAERVLPPGTEALAQSSRKEVKAWEQVWRGEFLEASQTAAEVAQVLTDESLSPYRALWLYFASAWQAAAAEESDDSALADASRQLLRKAHAAANGMSWIRELAPLPPGEVRLDPLDESAVATIAEHPARSYSGSRWAELTMELIAGLSGTDPGPYERALTTLGSLLGAEAYKPPGQGRADSVWVFDQLWWLTIEAKSAQRRTGLVSMEDVRQTNTQMRSLAADRASPIPDGSASVIVTPRQLVDSDAAAVANDNVFMCDPVEVLVLAQDTVDAWRASRAGAMNLEGAAARSVIAQRFADRRVLPSAIRERLINHAVSE